MVKFDNLSSKSTKRFAKTLLAIIIVFAVFACVFATIVLYFGKEFICDISGLICCLAASPFIVFLILIFLQGIVTSKWEKK